MRCSASARILAGRIAVHQAAQRRIGLLDFFRRTLGNVFFEAALQKARLALEIRQRLDVERVVDAGMDRVLAHERVGSFDRLFFLPGFVVAYMSSSWICRLRSLNG